MPRLFCRPWRPQVRGVLTSTTAAAAGNLAFMLSNTEVFTFQMYFLFDQVVPQVRRVDVASIAFHIRNILCNKSFEICPLPRRCFLPTITQTRCRGDVVSSFLCVCL